MSRSIRVSTALLGVEACGMSHTDRALTIGGRPGDLHAHMALGFYPWGRISRAFPVGPVKLRVQACRICLGRSSFTAVNVIIWM